MLRSSALAVPPRHGRAAAWATLLALGAVAFAMSFLAAQPYPGVTVDSGEYLAVAEGLTEGRGFTMPYSSYDEAFRALDPGERVHMTQFPPLYPLALAAVQEVVGLGRLDAVRVLGSSVYAVTMILAAALVWRATKSLFLTVVGGGLMLAPELVTVHAMAWSEGLMILGLVAALHLIIGLARSPSRWRVVWLGVMGAVASLARFVGIAVIFAGAVALDLSRKGIHRRRRLRPLAFSLVALVPTAIWFGHNIAVAGVASEKDLGWHPPGGRHLVQAVQTVGGWVVPERNVATVVGVLMILAAIAICWLRFGRLRSMGAGSVPRACLLVAMCYVGVVLVSRIFLDQNIPLDPRILAPVQVMVIVGVCSAAGQRNVAVRRSFVSGLLVLLAAAAIGRGVATAVDFSELGVSGYTGEKWLASETLEFAGTVDPDTVIVSNAPDPLWLWHGRTPMLIPPRSSLYSGQANRNYSLQLEEVRDVTTCREGLVIFFNHPTRKPARSIDPLVVYELGLTEIERFEDGAVYDIDEPRARCDGDD